MGGFIATQMNHLFHQRLNSANKSKVEIDSLLLLAPAFDMCSRLSEMLGAHNLKQWRLSSKFPFRNHATNSMESVDYSLIVDLEQYRPFPSQPPNCPFTIIHGLEDPVVPIHVSRTFLRQHHSESESKEDQKSPSAVVGKAGNVQLIEVQDDHLLTNPATLQTIEQTIFSMWGTQRKSPAPAASPTSGSN